MSSSLVITGYPSADEKRSVRAIPSCSELPILCLSVCSDLWLLFCVLSYLLLDDDDDDDQPIPSQVLCQQLQTRDRIRHQCIGSPPVWTHTSWILESSGTKRWIQSAGPSDHSDGHTSYVSSHEDRHWPPLAVPRTANDTRPTLVCTSGPRWRSRAYLPSVVCPLLRSIATPIVDYKN
jgi:hypothetical protein